MSLCLSPSVSCFFWKTLSAKGQEVVCLLDTYDARQIWYCNNYLFCDHELFKASLSLSHFCVLHTHNLFGHVLVIHH